jgi:hypothetical protein
LKPITFTFLELVKTVRKDNPEITDEEIEASIHILEHEGHLKKISKDIYSTTKKRPRCRKDRINKGSIIKKRHEL